MVAVFPRVSEANEFRVESSPERPHFSRQDQARPDVVSSNPIMSFLFVSSVLKKAPFQPMMAVFLCVLYFTSFTRIFGIDDDSNEVCHRATGCQFCVLHLPCFHFSIFPRLTLSISSFPIILYPYDSPNGLRWVI